MQEDMIRPELEQPATTRVQADLMPNFMRRVTPVSMSWNDVCFDVTKKSRLACGRKKAGSRQITDAPLRVLQNVSGSVGAGRVLAIMGGSGTGKTTLLKVLAGAVLADKKIKLSGTLLVNGAPRAWGTFRETASYVAQQDVFFAELTVEETITFAARLRLPSSTTHSERAKRVDEIINSLDLVKVRRAQVGSTLIPGLSGGERKRVSIGAEMVADPSILFLDEPTSGLDSFNAQNIMDSLNTLAQFNRTIVATIHQPRSHIFRSFDLLLLLADGGRVAYSGKADAATAHFAAAGFPCPKDFSPSDWFIDCLGVDRRSSELLASSSARIEYLVEYWSDVEQDCSAMAARGSSSRSVAARRRLRFDSGDLEEAEDLIVSSAAATEWGRDEVEIAVAETAARGDVPVANEEARILHSGRNGEVEVIDAASMQQRWQQQRLQQQQQHNCNGDSAPKGLENMDNILLTDVDLASEEGSGSGSGNNAGGHDGSVVDGDTGHRRKKIGLFTSSTSSFAQPWVVQFWELTRRAWRVMVRERATNLARLSQILLFSLLLGAIWFGEGNDLGGESAQSVAGVLFFISIQIGFNAVFAM